MQNRCHSRLLGCEHPSPAGLQRGVKSESDCWGLLNGGFAVLNERHARVQHLGGMLIQVNPGDAWYPRQASSSKWLRPRLFCATASSSISWPEESSLSSGKTQGRDTSTGSRNSRNVQLPGSNKGEQGNMENQRDPSRDELNALSTALGRCQMSKASERNSESDTDLRFLRSLCAGRHRHFSTWYPPAASLNGHQEPGHIAGMRPCPWS